MNQILVIKPSSLGDIIHALMVVEALRRERPQLQVDWVARDIFAPFVEACRTVRHTHVFLRKGGVVPFGQLVTQIRETDYDAVLDMQGLARSGLLCWLSGVPRRRRYGRSDARELSTLAYGKTAQLPKPAAGAEGGAAPVHAVDILRGFLPLFGVDAQVPLGTLAFGGVEPGHAAAAVLESRRPLILLFPESRRPEKEWAGFEALTDLLLQKPAQASPAVSLPTASPANVALKVPPAAPSPAVSPLAVPLVDTPASAEPASRGEPLVCWLGSVAVADAGRWPAERFVNLTGQTSIAELPLLVGKASVVVANDSGPMHLAAAMGRPVVALFGPTDPRRYGPYPLDAPLHRVLRAPGGLLADISPQRVAAEVADLLSL